MYCEISAIKRLPLMMQKKIKGGLTMRAWDIRTAEQCGILERCKAFEKGRTWLRWQKNTICTRPGTG